MSDYYIKLYDAINAITKEALTRNLDSAGGSFIEHVARSAHRIIAALPSADVRENKRGKWRCANKGYDFVDTNYHFDRAIMRMPDGEIVEVEIEKWADAEGEQLTITGKDGKRYLVNSVNCVLIEDKAE